VVVSKLSGCIVMGHGRRDAALDLGCKAPVDYQDFDSVDQELAVLVADNVIPELAEMDDVLLAANKDLIEAAGFDLEMIGFLDEDLDPDTDIDAQPRIDQAEELLEKWKVETGQLWQLGESRAYCGESKNYNFQDVDGILTDPPYNMDGESIIDIFEDIAPSAMALVGDKQAHELTKYWDLRLNFVWERRRPRSLPSKNSPVMYHIQCILITKNSKIKHGWQRPYPQFGSIIRCESEFKDTKMGHGKSAEIFTEMLCGFPWKIIADPFLGTGASLLAARKAGCTILGTEQIPSTFAVMLERYQESTGETPRLVE